MSINFRNLKPQYVEQDQFNWTQDNSLPADKELTNVYFYKAINLTNNGLQIFKEASQQLLDIRLKRTPIIIKAKPLIANGSLTLKPTYENMIANVAFAEQPEFMVFDPIISEIFGGTSIKPQQVEQGNGKQAQADQAVGNDLYFIRIENKIDQNKATWFIANNVQTQVNTDNSFSMSKLRLTPFNASLLPQNIKLKFSFINNDELATKATKYVRITTKPWTRIGNQRIVGFNADPRTTLLDAVQQNWKYENDPEGSIMVKEHPSQVSNQNVIWKSTWLQENAKMWGITKNGVKWPYSQYQNNIFDLSNTTGDGTDRHGSETRGLQYYPMMTIDYASFMFPKLDGLGDINKDILQNKAWEHANWNRKSFTGLMGSFGKKFIDGYGLFSDNDLYGAKFVNHNPFFNQRSKFKTDVAYSRETPTTISIAGFKNVLSFGTFLISTSQAESLWISAWRTQSSYETPDYKTRLEELMQGRGTPFYIPNIIDATETGNYEDQVRATAPSQVFYTELPAEKLTQVQASQPENFDWTNPDDRKYIFMTKSLYYDGDKTDKNANYPYTKFGDIGYVVEGEEGKTTSEAGSVRKAYFALKDFGEGDGDFNTSEREWKDEDLHLVKHLDWITYKNFGSQFTNAQLKNWYETTDNFKKNIPTDLVQEIELDNQTWMDRLTFILGAGSAGQDYKIEFFDISRNKIFEINDQFPQDETISQYTISTK